MFNKPQETIILKIGGSLIVPETGPNVLFLQKLNTFIREQVKYGRKFLLSIGGGKTARNYRDAGSKVIGQLTNDDLDWLGIHASHLNAHLVRTIFQDIAHPRIIENYDRKLDNWSEPVAIGAAWKPGWSTDYCATVAARDYNASAIIKLSNIDWIYDKDPNKYKDSKIIKKITWEDYQMLIGNTWVPGMNVPFDPIASQLANKLALTVIVTNGKSFANLKNILEGEEFKGTVITKFTFDASFYDRDYFEGRKLGVRYAQPFINSFFHFLINWYRALWIKLTLNPKNCLDAGCGTGTLVANLRKLGVETYGIEISDYALDAAPKEVKAYISKGNISSIPFEDNTFDLVVSFNVLEHLERSKLKKAADETIRVSRKWITHKVYTTDNWIITLIKGKHFSQLSVLSAGFWANMFKENEDVAVVRKPFFKFPTAFETIFLLRKK
ncbi:MAG TPA: methyltransferase domain-containing protein [Candidatus Nitrosocosmicus sp.]|nr:methyltransferase domain-containing protein [Candidatus Nitrosocosmicus sp.]